MYQDTTKTRRERRVHDTNTSKVTFFPITRISGYFVDRSVKVGLSNIDITDDGVVGFSLTEQFYWQHKPFETFIYQHFV